MKLPLPLQRDSPGHHSIGQGMFDGRLQEVGGNSSQRSAGDHDALYQLTTHLSRVWFAELTLRALLATYLAGSAWNSL